MPSGTRSSCSGRCRPWPASPSCPSPSSTGAASRASAPLGSWPPLAAVHPLLVWYSQDAALLLARPPLRLTGLARFPARCSTSRARPTCCGGALASAAAVVTHYTTVYFVIAQGVWLSARGPRIRGPMCSWRAAAWPDGLALGSRPPPVDDARTGWIRFIPLGDRLRPRSATACAGPSLPTWHPTFIVAVLAGARRPARPVAGRSPAHPRAGRAGRGRRGTRAAGAGERRRLHPRSEPHRRPGSALGLAAAGLASLPREWMTAAGAAAVCAALLAVTVVDLTDDRQQPARLAGRWPRRSGPRDAAGDRRLQPVFLAPARRLPPCARAPSGPGSHDP